MSWFSEARKNSRKMFSIQGGLFDQPARGPVATITRYGNGVGIRFIFEGKPYVCPMFTPPLLKNLQTLIARGDAETIRAKFIPNFNCQPE